MEKGLVDRAEAIQADRPTPRLSLTTLACRTRAAAIEERMARPDFWNNQEQAQATVAELKELRALEKPLEEAITAADDIAVMLEMADEDEVDGRRAARASSIASKPWSPSWS